MLEKLLSLLPYNPSIAHQLGFYAHRMREEATIRRTGMVFIILAFLVQFMAVASPPKSSATASPNDLIYGGISSVSDAVSTCTSNTKGYKVILDFYGITCKDVSASSVVTITSTQYGKGKDSFWSMGRKAYAIPGETNVTIPDSNCVNDQCHWRYLWGWDTGSHSTYQALRLKSALTGKTYYILFDCGNLVSVGLPPPYVTKPKPKPKPKPCKDSINQQDTLDCVIGSKSVKNITQNKADADGTLAQPGDILVYTLSGQNISNVTAKKYQFQDDFSDVFVYSTLVDAHGGKVDNTGLITWPVKNIGAKTTATVQVTVKVDNPIPATPADPGDRGLYDLKMTNTFGNTVNVSVPPPLTKVIETTATTLPNTGPGTGLMIAGSISLVAGYLFARSRLLSKEAGIAAKSNFVNG